LAREEKLFTNVHQGKGQKKKSPKKKPKKEGGYIPLFVRRLEEGFITKLDSDQPNNFRGGKEEGKKSYT